jgi:hypothetical protein
MGAAEGFAYSSTEAFMRTGLMGGSAVDAVMAGWNAGVLGAKIGGPPGAMFHELCFADGTLVHKQVGELAVETQGPCDRFLTLDTVATAHLPGNDPTAVDPKNCRLVRLRTTDSLARLMAADNFTFSQPNLLDELYAADVEQEACPYGMISQYGNACFSFFTPARVTLVLPIHKRSSSMSA